MNKGWLSRKMLPETQERMLQLLDEREARTIIQVAEASGLTRHSVYHTLMRMLAVGLVSREIRFRSSAPCEYLYRKIPAEIEGVPLNDREEGWDLTELARCFDWFTFRKRGTMQAAG
jgi:predicted transcriptional regulator